MVQSCVRTNRTRFLSNLQVGQLEVKKKCFAELNTKRLRETASKKTRWTPPRKWFYGMPSSLGMKTARSVVPYLPFCFPIFRVTRLKKNAFAKENKSEASYFSQTYLLTFDGKRNMFFFRLHFQQNMFKIFVQQDRKRFEKEEGKTSPSSMTACAPFFSASASNSAYVSLYAANVLVLGSSKTLVWRPAWRWLSCCSKFATRKDHGPTAAAFRFFKTHTHTGCLGFTSQAGRIW